MPFGPVVKKALWEYSQWRGEVPSQDIFFLDQFGGQPCARHIQITPRRYGQAAGLQPILGHSTLEMVRNYVNLASRDVYDQHRKFSPMDCLLAGP